MPHYTVGERLRSRVSTVEAVVIRPPTDGLEITCAGIPLARAGEEADLHFPRTEAAIPLVGGAVTVLGKRYVDEHSGVELLCVAAGAGQLAADARPMVIKAPQPLPSSD